MSPTLPLARNAFSRPLSAEDQPATYLCGHSLGPCPRAANEAIAIELARWRELGVRGHFEGALPWVDVTTPLQAPLARLTGAHADEVVAMNGLSVNLHLMLSSFFKPQGKRHLILTSHHAFPSDRLALASQCRFHGLNPDDCLIDIAPNLSEKTSSMESMTDSALRTIARHGDQLALVCLDAVDYAQGEVVDIASVTRAAHEVGAIVGFDLAHAIGNIPLNLSMDGVDFAVWCGYKYLNGGPGGLAGAFVHRRHHHNDPMPRLEGWWGQHAHARFNWGQQPAQRSKGAAAWQLSNPPVLEATLLRMALKEFECASMTEFLAHSQTLVGLARNALSAFAGSRMNILTPAAPSRHGAMLSIQVTGRADSVVEALLMRGVVCDARGPDVLRASFCPLYNGADDIQAFAEALEDVL